MHNPPATIQVGDMLTQDEIEDVFDTGFGYRISGINPRRDEKDNRYILVFANKDGPYDDSVKHGQFEYIGEGLEGDQSEDSPGNSVLIDAISADVPVYFFYSETDKPDWEYQGQVDVLSYRHETRNGREVLVFTMAHQGNSPPARLTGLYLIPVNEEWRDWFRSSVETPHNFRQYGTMPPELAGIDQQRIWGTTETGSSKKQSAIDRMTQGDCVLFYHDGEFIAGGTVGRTFENPAVGDLLWNNPESRHIFTVEEFTTDVPTTERVWDMLGYTGRQVVQGFTRVSDDRISTVRNEYDSLEAALFGDSDDEPSTDAIEGAKTDLEEAIESEPQLRDDDPQHVETRRKARDRACELIRENYDNTCAVCGSNRESPNGAPEVEAAHIYPKAEGGRDDPRNGVALCRLHHWAFDTGWISFTDDHEIVVADASDRNGYHELKQLEGQSLRVPDIEDAAPHPIFLEQHRLYHGFEP